MGVKPDYYKKSGIVLMKIARDFITMKAGDRIPTIYEYTELFKASRGVVQTAIATLEKEGCISIEKKGVKGTFLTFLDYEKLQPYANFGSVTGTMPVPLNPYLSSLTTAICEEMEEANFPFSFAYVTGARKRLEALKDMIYDFMIVSKSTAQIYLKEYDFLNMCMCLDECIYSMKYVVYFLDNTKTEIEDGMRVGIDEKCTDQAMITKALCKDKKVEFVNFRYIGFGEAIDKKAADCFVYRMLDEEAEKTSMLGCCPIGDIEGFSQEETMTPVVLTNKANYGMDRLLKKYLLAGQTKKIQDEVLAGRRSMKFY